MVIRFIAVSEANDLLVKNKHLSFTNNFLIIITIKTQIRDLFAPYSITWNKLAIF